MVFLSTPTQTSPVRHCAARLGDFVLQDWQGHYLDTGNLQTVELYHSRLYTPLAIDFHVFVSGAVASSPLVIPRGRLSWVPQWPGRGRNRK